MKDNNFELIIGEKPVEEKNEIAEVESTTEVENTTEVESTIEAKTESSEEAAEKSTEKENVVDNDVINEEVENIKKNDVDTSSELDINFGNLEQLKESTTQGKETNTSVQINDDLVLNYLRDNGLEFKSLNEIGKKEQLSESVERFKEFEKETGRGIKDYFYSQRDWKSEAKDVVIKEYLSFKNPNLTEKEIETKLNAVRVTESDREELEDDPRRLNRLESEYNELYSESVNYMSELSSKYKIPNETPKQEVSNEPSKEELKIQREYIDNMANDIDSFQDISIKVGDMGSIKLSLDDEDKEYLKNKTSSINSIMEGWFDKKGKPTSKKILNDVIGLNPVIMKILKNSLTQMHTLVIEHSSNTRRNLTIDKEVKPKQKNNSDVKIYGLKPNNKGVSNIF